MSVGVYNPGSGQGGMGLGRLASLGIGLYTGNPMMIAGGMMSGNSPAGKALGAYNTVSNLANSGTPKETGASSFSPQDPTFNSLGSQDYSDFFGANARRMQGYQNKLFGGGY
jgi:hypothetical protein